MTLATSVLEHRRHPRIPCRLSANIREVDSDLNPSTVGELRRQNQEVLVTNLSLGGVGLEGVINVQPGRILRIEFSIPEHNHQAAFVEICWMAGKRFGLRFLALSDKGLNDLRAFITKQNILHHKAT
jgi:hypothetical protein